MTLHPEIQIRAQAEIDAVVGDTWQRMPSLSDRAKLPYVSAIVLELLRWNPAVPLGQCNFIYVACARQVALLTFILR